MQQAEEPAPPWQSRISLFSPLLQDYFRTPSDHEPFQDVISNWMKDQVFTEQRLAGLNPMSLQRVTLHGRKLTNMAWSQHNRNNNNNNNKIIVMIIIMIIIIITTV